MSAYQLSACSDDGRDLCMSLSGKHWPSLVTRTKQGRRRGRGGPGDLGALDRVYANREERSYAA